MISGGHDIFELLFKRGYRHGKNYVTLLIGISPVDSHSNIEE